MKEDLLFGKIALLNNIITKEQLEEAICIQKKAKPMRSLSFILRGKGYIKKNQIKAILQAQRKNLPRPVKSPEERKEDMAFGYIAFRNDYITVDDIVKCLKTQGDIAKKNLLFRLSEILFNEHYLTWENIEEIVRLQLTKILHCEKCSTPYNVVGLPAQSRFPCRKCKNILEVSLEIAELDETERLDNYKRSIEDGIKVEQEKEKLLKTVEPAILKASNEEVDIEEEDIEISDEESNNEETVPQKEISTEKKTPEGFMEEDDDEFVEEDSSIMETGSSKNEDSLLPEEQDIHENQQQTDEEYYELEEEFLEEVVIDSGSRTREIALDTDEIYAEEMPDPEDVAAKSLAETKHFYNNNLKRKEEFEIKTSDLSFLEDSTYSIENLEIESLQSFSHFNEDDFFINENDFFEETVYNNKNYVDKLPKEIENRKKIENSTIKIISDKSIFNSRLKIDSTDEDSIEEILLDEENNIKKSGTSNIPKKKTSSFSFGNLKTTKNKYKTTRIANINSNNLNEELDEISEDDLISIDSKILKKNKK